MSTKPEALQVQELAFRKGDRLEVTLWWIKNTLDTYVEVIDHTTQPPTHHHIDVIPPISPNEVFNHPFRYV